MYLVIHGDRVLMRTPDADIASAAANSFPGGLVAELHPTASATGPRVSLADEVFAVERGRETMFASRDRILAEVFLHGEARTARSRITMRRSYGGRSVDVALAMPVWLLTAGPSVVDVHTTEKAALAARRKRREPGTTVERASAVIVRQNATQEAPRLQLVQS